MHGTGSSRLSPIFILGAMQRCGTNFLHNLLSIHPHVEPGGVIWEDFLIYYAEHLATYVNSLYEHWNQHWDVTHTLGPPDLLFHDLGDGLLSFLNRQYAALGKDYASSVDPRASYQPIHQISKSPSVRSIPLFFRLFPDAYLIIIPDGRSVAESGVKSFAWSYEPAFRKWSLAARTIRQFASDTKETNLKLRVVRYEDLYLNQEAELTHLLNFLALDKNRFDFERAKTLPILGSSQIKDQFKEITWSRDADLENFNPIDRWRDWSDEKHDRFNWIAGDELEYFGYRKHVPASVNVVSKLRNHLKDTLWKIRSGD